MSRLSALLYTYSLFNTVIATAQLLSPEAMISGPPLAYLSALTGLPLGTVNESLEIAMSLKMYIIALVMWNGARRDDRGIGTAALVGTMTYATGTLATVALRPKVEGSVGLLFTGVIYVLWAAGFKSVTEWHDVSALFVGSGSGGGGKRKVK